MKRYVTTRRGVTGKGANVINFFRCCADLKVRAAAIFDADLESISPYWIKHALDPVVYHHYDFVYPIYKRHRYDGTTTNLLCRPVLAGVFGTDIVQPIGGDFAFSANFVHHIVRARPPAAARRFGIDIFLTTEALLSGFAICGTQLGTKVHTKRERSTKGPMTLDVAGVLFRQIARSHVSTKQGYATPCPVTFEHPTEPVARVPEVPADLQAIEDLFVSGFRFYDGIYRCAMTTDTYESLVSMATQVRPIAVGTECWCRILHSLLRAYMLNQDDRDVILESLIAVFFARMSTFIRDIKTNEDRYVVEYLERQVRYFREFFEGPQLHMGYRPDEK